MDHNQQDRAFESFVGARLNQIEKYILAHKINNEKSKMIEKQLEQQRKRIDIIQERMKLMQLNMDNNFDQLDRLTRKVQKVVASVQGSKKMETKVYDLLKSMEQTYKKVIKKADLQNLQEKIISDMKIQLKSFEFRVKSFEQQIYYIQQYLITMKPQKETPPISMSSVILPTQLLVTKKQLRQNMELIEQVYSKKIKKLEKKIKSFKNNKINKTVAELEQKFDQYDLSKNRKSQHSQSKSRSVVDKLFLNESDTKNNIDISFKRSGQKKIKEKSNEISKRVSFSLAKKRKRREHSHSPYSLQLKINGRNKGFD